MASSTFKVLFYLKKRSEKNGKVPVMGRITVNGTISQFSCKLHIRPSLWDTEANKASGKSVEAQRINEKLENIKTNIGKQYQRICDRDSYVTADKVKNAWQGFGDDCRLLMQTFDEYLAAFAKRVGKDRASGTFNNVLSWMELPIILPIFVMEYGKVKKYHNRNRHSLCRVNCLFERRSKGFDEGGEKAIVRRYSVCN